MTCSLHTGRFDSRKKAESYANPLRGAGLKNIQIKEIASYDVILTGGNHNE